MILIICLSLFPVFWFIQNVIHEYSHLSTAKLFGAKMIKFIPWPTKQLYKWYFAYSEWKATKYITKENRIRIYKAPLIANKLQFLLYFFLAAISFKTPYGEEYWWVFLYLSIFPLVDFLTWTYGYYYGSETSDGQIVKRLQKELKLQ